MCAFKHSKHKEFPPGQDKIDQECCINVYLHNSVKDAGGAARVGIEEKPPLILRWPWASGEPLAAPSLSLLFVIFLCFLFVFMLDLYLCEVRV